jgi:hypothetical protein
MSRIEVTDEQLDAMYPSLRPAPAPAPNSSAEQLLYPRSPQMFEPSDDWLPRNLEPGLAAMYPTCALQNREEQERAYLQRVAPDLSQHDRFRIAETLAKLSYEDRNKLVGHEGKADVQLRLLRASR